MLSATFTSRTCKFTTWRWRCPTCAANSSFPSWRRCTTSSWWEAKSKESCFSCDSQNLSQIFFNSKFNYYQLPTTTNRKNSTPNNTQQPCPWWIIEFCDQQQPNKKWRKKQQKSSNLEKKLMTTFWRRSKQKKIRLLKILEKIILKLKRISCMYRVLFWDFVKKT